VTEDKPPSRVLRQRFEQEYALPLARAMFELESRCESTLFTIGQYWCDEASDAVHGETIACAERDPSWPLAGQAHPGVIGDADALADALKEAAQPDSDGPVGVYQVQWALLEAAHERAFGQKYFGVLDDNTDMIVAFASYCREVSDQEQPSWRSHTPYGLVRRPLAGEPLRFEVIGSMYRPQWEDRWDVLEKDGIISDWDGGTPEPPVTGPASTELAATAVAPRAPRKLVLSQPVYRVLLFSLLVGAIVAVRACFGR